MIKVLLCTFLFIIACEESIPTEITPVTSTYHMPGIIISSDILVSIYNTLSFDQIVSEPNDLQWHSDTTLLSYDVDENYEVLHYMYTCTYDNHEHEKIHKIEVSSNNYILKDTSTNNIYKLYFMDYHLGVVLFKYAKINESNPNITEVTTKSFYIENFYYNLNTGTENISNWNISLQKINVDY